MAQSIEYETSSNVATLKEFASNTQLATVVKEYTGAFTYDDEIGSKYATVTINGKSQRALLCIAVSGTVVYDGVPSIYSMVGGHKCMNIVEPAGTEVIDDVPSVNETITISGKSVRATRVILITETPIYDGLSNVCTFVDSNTGDKHSAVLVNVIQEP